MRHAATRLVPTLPALALAALLATGLSPLARASEPGPVTLDRVGSAELLWKGERGWIPLPVADVDVELSITGLMARGRVTQRFANPTDEVIEAVYAFPLPELAAVHHVELRIGERRIVSEIREREEARRTYERARETGRKASLLDQRRPNLFTTSVANINPGETVEIVLEYFEEVRYEDGRFGLRFPLVFLPRFAPPASADGSSERTVGYGDSAVDGPRGRGAVLPRAHVEVSLRPGFRLESVSSASHALELEQRGDALRIATRRGGVVADRDFLLEWRPEAGDMPRTATFVEERDGERFALVLVLPPAGAGELALGWPTETLFVVDVSGSMAGPSIEQARRALLAALERLRPEDRFNLLVFNDASHAFRAEFQQAEPGPLEEARRWVAGLEAGGGTMIYPALMRGLEMMGRSRSSHAQRIVFVTDGAVANEQEVLRAVAERIGEARLHTVGIGAAPNAYLMRKMARFGRGLCTFVADTSLAERAIAGFFERIDRPVIEDLELHAAEGELFDVYPGRLPDLYAGEPLLISMRLGARGPVPALAIGGHGPSGRIVTQADPGAEARPGSGIAMRWARARVEEAMERLVEGADAAVVRDEVVALALRFDLVTRYTSLVAVEQVPTAFGPGHTVGAAAALPAGGTSRPLELRLGALLLVAGLIGLAALRASEAPR